MDSLDRPKITIPKSTSEWVWDLIGGTFLIGSIILLLLVWNQLPQKVPIHYNLHGEVDYWGSKGMLIIIPLVAIFIALIMYAFEKFPEYHNYPKRFNESNAAQFYLHSRKLLNQVKNICLIILAVVIFEFVSIPLGWWGGFGVWLLPILLLAIFIPIGLSIYRQRQIK